MDGKQFATGWHLDKRVPITIIMAVIVQTAGLVLWAGKLDSRVQNLEQQSIQSALSIEGLKASQNSVAVGLARIEERQSIMNENLREIKSAINGTRHERPR
jgi:Tfp pilus assembly protein PilO